MQTIQTTPLTATPLTATPLTGTPLGNTAIGGTPAHRGPGRPPGAAGAKDWKAVAVQGGLATIKIGNLSEVLSKFKLLNNLRKNLPVHKPVADQMALVSEALASGDPAAFQAAMAEAQRPLGTAPVRLEDYAKTANTVELEREEINDVLNAFCKAFKINLALQDERVLEYVAAKEAEAAKAKETADALKSEGDDSADDDSAYDDSADDDSADDDSADDDSAV